ncbi:MAG TPA: hypothetical protein PLG59_01310 [bacterium]|nr:hypothetical protein [bacterium]HQO33268.1 hypothetical protein [bacterium]HQP99785.1 hypothetical protein [bacterium]
MTNPLDRDIEDFRTAMQAFKVVRRVLDARSDPLSNTDFYIRTRQEGHEMLDRAEKQLNQLAAFALFAAFERTLRDHLSSNLSPIQSAQTIPPERADRLHDFLEKGVDNWRIDNVIELFAPPAEDQDINNAKNIRTHRHHVAHGEAPPVSIPPQTVYKQLSDFLGKIGLTV